MKHKFSFANFRRHPSFWGVALVAMIYLTGGIFFLMRSYYDTRDLFDLRFKGDELCKQKRYRESIKCYNKVLFYDSSIINHLDMAYCYIGLKDYNKALHFLKKYEKYNNCIESDYLFGVIYFKQNKFEMSKKYLTWAYFSRKSSKKCKKQCMEMLNIIDNMENINQEEVLNRDDI